MTTAEGTADAGALLALPDAQRECVLATVDGRDEDLLTTPVLPSGWTPLGMIEHPGHAERHWFQVVALGSAAPLPWPEDPPGPRRTSVTGLRTVTLHMTEETARHVGHLDAARELLDEQTGLGPGRAPPRSGGGQSAGRPALRGGHA